jgi:Fe-S cluster biogenesis protein NfuA/nitrite reductase/ring-hydroxylating ferredoxin subunit
MVANRQLETAADPGSRRLERVEELTDALEALEDGEAKELAEELVVAIVELYGDGLERIMAALGDDRATGAELRERLVADGVVASLLLVHDLYPVPLEERVAAALGDVRPYMESHGGNVELVALEDGVARLRLVGHCHGCPSSLSTLELAIKDALLEHAPDLLDVEVEGLTDAGPATPAQVPSWLAVEAAGDVAPGELRLVEAGDTMLLVANVDGALLAYRSQCPCCGAGLGEATLEAEILTCERCGHGFSLTEAGRALGSDDVFLEPVPMLRRHQGLSVAHAS